LLSLTLALATALFIHRRHFSACAVTMSEDTEAAALRAWLEAIIKKTEDTEA
jgi:hypothetical protein